MTRTTDAIVRHWPWLALLASAAVLATALASERFGGLVPCALCMDQRKVYWAALAIAAVAVIVRATPLRRRFDRLFAALLAAAFLTGVFVAGRHAGIEYGWLPPLDTCGAAGGAIDPGAMAALAKGTSTSRIVPCDEVQWRMGLTMAGWNVVASLILAGLSVLAALTPARNGLRRG